MGAVVESVSVSILSSGGIKVPQDVQDGDDGGSREFRSVGIRILFGSSRGVIQVAVGINIKASGGFRFTGMLVGERRYDGFMLYGK